MSTVDPMGFVDLGSTRPPDPGSTALGSGRGDAVDTSGYLETAKPAPAITGCAPATGPAAGGTALVVTGTGFTGATGLQIGSNTATAFVVVNASTIHATTPGGSVGAKNLVVQHPAGNVTKVGIFAYT